MAWQQPKQPPPPMGFRRGNAGSSSPEKTRRDGTVPPPRSMHETEMRRSPSSFRMPPPPPPHSSFARGQSPHGPPPPRPYGESPPPYHYASNYQGPARPPPFSSHPFYGEQSLDSFDLDLRNASGCTCKKSKCLKLYCQCFASSVTCGPRCKCKACHNTTLQGPAIEEARRVILERNPCAFQDKFAKEQNQPSIPPPLPHAQIPYYTKAEEWEGSPARKQHKSGCKCRRSYCLKKYCECFHHGARCGDMCRCINCKNKPNSDSPEPPATSRSVRLPPKEVVVQPAFAERRFEPPRINHRQVRPRYSPPRVSPPPSRSPPLGTSRPVPNKRHEENKENRESKEDQMAIMAAVAMTELFGKPSQPVVRHVSEEQHEPRKRKLDSPKEEPQKRKAVSPTTSVDEEEVRAVVSSESSPTPSVVSHGSREMSPVSRGYPPVYGYYNRNHGHSRGMGPMDGMFPHMRGRGGPFESSSSLPKSLSFRKICSKCGKTRGEHGELGFGNKCVYQDCGRCGAGVQMHVKANKPMGFLCTLTVKEGATPGAAEMYHHKIHDLAVRADLQRRLNLPTPQRRVKA